MPYALWFPFILAVTAYVVLVIRGTENERAHRYRVEIYLFAIFLVVLHIAIKVIR